MRPVKYFHELITKPEKVDAVILNPEQMGETTKKLSIEIRKEFPEINWQVLLGFEI